MGKWTNEFIRRCGQKKEQPSVLSVLPAKKCKNLNFLDEVVEQVQTPDVSQALGGELPINENKKCDFIEIPITCTDNTDSSYIKQTELVYKNDEISNIPIPNADNTDSCNEQDEIENHEILKIISDNNKTTQSLANQLHPSPPQVNVIPNSTNDFLDDLYIKAEKYGMLLLKDDKDWIRKLLYGIPIQKAKVLMTDYILHWYAAMRAEPALIKKDNAGRRAANTGLRETLDP